MSMGQKILSWARGGIGAVLLAGTIWGQGNGDLRARELFYTPPPGTAPAVSAGSSPAAPSQNQAKVAPGTTAKPAVKEKAARTASSKTDPERPTSPKISPASPLMEAAGGQTAVAAAELAIPLGLRYSVLKRNAGGTFEEVDPDGTFHSGDRIRIEARANTTGYLYVVTQGSSGSWQVLFPSREVAGGSNQVHRGEARQVPSGERGQFVFDEQAGEERLFIVLTRQPETNLDKLIYSMPVRPNGAEPARVVMAGTLVTDDVISRMRGQLTARDLVFEKVENHEVADAGQKGGAIHVETAAYVVNPSKAADARLVVDLKLKHR